MDKEHKTLDSLVNNIRFFIKWSAFSLVIGCVTGVIGSVFSRAMVQCGIVFRNNPQAIYALPFIGLFVRLIYHIFHEDRNRGTNMIIESISKKTVISKGTAPSIFFGALLTQLGGGSAGREGAAVQIGGSLGSVIGRIFYLDESEMKIAVMCGMSGCFAAVFGTPLAATVFSMEVISVGVMYYSALIPCLFSAFIGASIADMLHVEAERYVIGEIIPFKLEYVFLIILFGLLCAGMACVFCIVMHLIRGIYDHYIHNNYVRVFAGGCLVVLMTKLSGGFDYNGSGALLIEKAFEGDAPVLACFLKTLFTAVTLEAGFKGGEIVPTLTVGATMGSVFAKAAGLPVGLMSACGMMGLFVGVTNCPITTLLMALELFGGEGISFIAIVVAVSFTLSGYYSLYASQKIVYSKIRNQFINRMTN